VNTLSFDAAFQERVVRLLFQEKGFAEVALAHLPPKVFDSPVHGWFVKKLRMAHQQGVTPDLLYLRQERRKDVSLGLLKKTDQGAYIRFIKHRIRKPVPNRSYVKKELQDFVYNQRVKEFILDAVDKKLPQRQWDEMKKSMVELVDFDLSGEESIGQSPGNTVEKRIRGREEVKEDGVTTGIAELDRLMVRGGLTPKQLGTCIAPTGRGKCLGKGTPVLLSDGTIKPVEKVRLGDFLMGPDSRPRLVESLARGRAPLFRIEPSKGDPWVCNDIHVLTLVHTQTGETVDVPLNEYLTWSKTQKHLHKQFGVGVNFWAHGDVRAVSPYFLGVWFGDGAKRTDVVRVTTSDKAVVAALEEEASAWGLKVTEYPDLRTANVSTYGIVGRQGVRNKLGVELATLVSSDFTVPQAYLTAPEKDRLEFLAGWLDTDGALHYGGFDFCQKRKDYVDAVAFLARSLGFKVVTRAPRVVKGETYHRIAIAGDCSRIPTRLPHKQADRRRQVKDALRTGFKVTPLGEGDYYGFTLDGDGRFLLGDFTVTHNTNFLINCAAEAVLEGVPTLYITLELDEDTILTRMDARFTGVPIKHLRSNVDEVRQAWRKVKKRVTKNLVVKEMPPGTTTVAHIKQHLRRLERRGFYPKMLVIDYADLLKPRIEFADSSYETQGQVYLDILGLLAEMKMVGWTATQGNRKSMDADANGDVDLSMMADSVKKAFLAYVVVGLAQSEKEKKLKKARLALLKNRNGPADRHIKLSVEHDVVTFRSLK
jgi:replicative DNA helicase